MAEKRFIIEVRTKGFSRATRDFDNLDKNKENKSDIINKLVTNELISNFPQIEIKDRSDSELIELFKVFLELYHTYI